ncbi:MAG: ABC transporter permease, partial [Actinomycetes bacterium]
MSTRKRIEFWAPFVVLLATILLWQLIVWMFSVPEFIFHSPLQIAREFLEFREPLLEAAWKTFWVTM